MALGTSAAVVRRRGGPFEFEDVEIDDPRPDEVVVRIVGCGVCHTDIAARDGLLGMRFPAVLGHEGAGFVEKVGRDVSRVRPGDGVVLSFGSCGKCASCHAGRPARCTLFEDLNFGGTRTDGTSPIVDAKGTPLSWFFGQSCFAFHALARERNVVPVDAAGESELAIFAPLGCGVQAGAGTVLNELKPGPGESFAVFGAGTVGLSALMAARLAGAAPLIAVDIVSSRLEMALELGATHAIDAREENVGTRLAAIAGKLDHAVDTTGRSRVIDQAVRSLGPRGNLSMLGISADSEEEEVLPKAPGHHRRVFYSIAGDSNPQEFIPFLIRCYREGKFPFNRLIRKYPALEINEAAADSSSGITIKPLLRFRT